MLRPLQLGGYDFADALACEEQMTFQVENSLKRLFGLVDSLAPGRCPARRFEKWSLW